MAGDRTTNEQVVNASRILNSEAKDNNRDLEARQRTEFKPLYLFSGHLLYTPYLPTTNDLFLLAVTLVLGAGSTSQGHSTQWLAA